MRTARLLLPNPTHIEVPLVKGVGLVKVRMEPETADQEFVIGGRNVRLSPARVRSAVEGQEPGRVRTHAVEIDGRVFAVKEALALATGLDLLDFNTNQARAILRRLGFSVRRIE